MKRNDRKMLKVSGTRLRAEGMFKRRLIEKHKKEIKNNHIWKGKSDKVCVAEIAK